MNNNDIVDELKEVNRELGKIRSLIDNLPTSGFIQDLASTASEDTYNRSRFPLQQLKIVSWLLVATVILLFLILSKLK